MKRLRSTGRGCAEGALEGGFGNGFVAVIGEGVEHAAGAVRALGEKDRNSGLQGLVAKVRRAGVAVDAIQKRREINELVAGFDELEVEKFLFGGHAGMIRRNLTEFCRKMAVVGLTFPNSPLKLLIKGDGNSEPVGGNRGIQIR